MLPASVNGAQAAKESEVNRLKKVEEGAAQRARHELDLARQLAASRLQVDKLRAERDGLRAQVGEAHAEAEEARREQASRRIAHRRIVGVPSGSREDGGRVVLVEWSEGGGRVAGGWLEGGGEGGGRGGWCG